MVNFKTQLESDRAMLAFTKGSLDLHIKEGEVSPESLIHNVVAPIIDLHFRYCDNNISMRELDRFLRNGIGRKQDMLEYVCNMYDSVVYREHGIHYGSLALKINGFSRNARLEFISEEPAQTSNINGIFQRLDSFFNILRKRVLKIHTTDGNDYVEKHGIAEECMGVRDGLVGAKKYFVDGDTIGLTGLFTAHMLSYYRLKHRIYKLEDKVANESVETGELPIEKEK